MKHGLTQFGVVLLTLSACTQSTSPTPSPTPEPFQWALPIGFPEPIVPDDNPMSTVKVELGRLLFYDTQLSGNQTYACASCHKQERAFTDGLAHAVGSTGEIHRRSAMGLTGVAYNTAFTWANPTVTNLEEQALGPMFGETPVELGLSGMEDELFFRLSSDPEYPSLFQQAFPEADPVISLDTITKALAAFERTLISGNSPYDKFIYQGQGDAISDSAKRGRSLFFSETFECYHCHGTFNFTDSVTFKGTSVNELFFHNTGLYNIDGAGAYPAVDPGLVEMTGEEADTGRFRAPTLRNIACSAPYMHDGSVSTLFDALQHYAAGGRTIAEGEYAGNGSESPYKSEFVRGFELTDQDATDLLNFLLALTDMDFLTDEDISDPFLKSESVAFDELCDGISDE